MLKIVKDKKVLIAVIILLLLVIGIVIGILVKQDSDESVKKEPENDVEIEYNAPSLEVDEDDGTNEDSVDVPGTWDDTTSDSDATGSDDKADSNTTDNTGNKDDNGATDNPDDNTDDSNDDNKDDDDSPDEDIIIDDKDWGKIF